MLLTCQDQFNFFNECGSYFVIMCEWNNWRPVFLNSYKKAWTEQSFYGLSWLTYYGSYLTALVNYLCEEIDYKIPLTSFGKTNKMAAWPWNMFVYPMFS